MSEAFTLSTVDPRFDPNGPVQINGYGFVPAPRVEWRSMSEAPTDGTLIMAEVDEVEMPVVWWVNFEAWREVHPNMSDVGEIVEPRRWRDLTTEENARG